MDFSKNFGDPTGSEQIAHMLTVGRSVLKRSTLIMGVDAFYWDAAWNSCRYGWPQAEIPELIEFARDHGIPLVLGTVPHEDASKVWWSKLGTLREYAWTKPVDSCVDAINETIRRYCLREENCHIADLEEMVRVLNSGGKLRTLDGQSHALREMRPDGVHVSASGSRYIAEQVLESFRAQSPGCIDESANGWK